MKKIFLICCCVFFIFALQGCGKQEITPEGVWHQPVTDSVQKESVWIITKIADASYNVHYYTKEYGQWIEGKGEVVVKYDKDTKILSAFDLEYIMVDDNHIKQLFKGALSQYTYERVTGGEAEKLKKTIGAK